MPARHDGTSRESIRIEVSNVSRPASRDPEIEHLVEVAIEEATVPADREHRPTHQTRDGLGIECDDQLIEVLFNPARRVEVFKEPADRHVRDREEPVELDPKPFSKFPAEIGFERGLIGRQRGTDRVINQVQNETAGVDAVTEPVEPSQRFDGAFENSFAALPSVFSAV